MYRITDVRPLPEYHIWIRFDDGVEGEVDLSDLVGKGVFAAWEDPDHFKKVFVNPESRTVTWPGDIDLDPDVLYHEVTGAPLPGTGDVQPDMRVKDVRFTDKALSVDLADGRTITVPLAWYPPLLHATPEQREKWEIVGAGYGIYWPEVDEDLSVEELLRGVPPPAASVKV